MRCQQQKSGSGNPSCVSARVHHIICACGLLEAIFQLKV